MTSCHRKVWIEEQLHRLAANFGIDLLGFAILSNHFHLIGTTPMAALPIFERLSLDQRFGVTWSAGLGAGFTTWWEARAFGEKVESGE